MCWAEPGQAAGTRGRAGSRAWEAAWAPAWLVGGGIYFWWVVVFLAFY